MFVGALLASMGEGVHVQQAKGNQLLDWFAGVNALQMCCVVLSLGELPDTSKVLKTTMSNYQN